ncbi:MAG TPA: DNA polymerase III subunit gamma/tau, partial [Terriglobales bacterium]|nr:DNA polymerase III subunit gamma/tau [Terriglobales bacterium]
MSYQVLARKYRPQRFADVIGQEHVTRTLKNAIEQGRIAHGYIFSGHRGIGKTTIARILAAALNCRSADHPVPEPCGVCESCTEIRAGNSVDVIEIDAATNRGIDEIRELREAARYRPARDRFKIYILDEAHQITDAAFNALLKTLEEPPSHIVFMMATTQPEDIPQTIRSRCQHFSFHAVRFDATVRQLRDIARREGIEVDENALAMLAEAGDGSMRDALSIMDQAIACCGTQLSGDTVRQLVGTVPSEVIESVFRAIQQNSSEEVLRIVDRLLTEGQNPVHFARQIVRFLRNVLVAKVAGSDSSLLQISADERERVSRVAEMFGEEDLTRFLQILLRTHSELSYKQEQRFHLELGLLKLVHAQRLLPLEQLLSGAAQTAAPSVSKTSPATRVSPPAPAANPFARSEPTRPSPFEADRARKTRTETSSNPAGENGSAAALPATRGVSSTAVAIGDPVAPDADAVRQHVLNSLEGGDQKSLVGLLETGEWKVTSNVVWVKPEDAKSVTNLLRIFVSAQQALDRAASSALGRPAKVQIVADEAPGNGTSATSKPATPQGSARSRAANDPIVKRVQEKFGAEI